MLQIKIRFLNTHISLLISYFKVLKKSFLQWSKKGERIYWTGPCCLCWTWAAFIHEWRVSCCGMPPLSCTKIYSSFSPSAGVIYTKETQATEVIKGCPNKYLGHIIFVSFFPTTSKIKSWKSSVFLYIYEL